MTTKKNKRKKEDIEESPYFTRLSKRGKARFHSSCDSNQDQTNDPNNEYNSLQSIFASMNISTGKEEFICKVTVQMKDENKVHIIDFLIMLHLMWSQEGVYGIEMEMLYFSHKMQRNMIMRKQRINQRDIVQLRMNIKYGTLNMV